MFGRQRRRDGEGSNGGGGHCGGDDGVGCYVGEATAEVVMEAREWRGIAGGGR